MGIKADYIPSEKIIKGLLLETFTRHVKEMGLSAPINLLANMPKIIINS